MSRGRPGWRPRWWRRRRGRPCAGRPRALRRRPILRQRRRLHSRVRGAASAPPSRTSPAGWPCRCPRCRAPSRARARTGRGRPPPSEALGSIPSEPVSMAASSLRMSPNRFSVTITSKSAGRETSCIAALSTSRCSSGTSGNSSACTRVTVSRHSREVSSTLALSTLVTLVRADSEADPGDALDLGHAVGAVVVGGVAVAARLAEVDAAGELAHHEQVGALDPVALQRAGVEQRGARAAPGAGWRTGRGPCAGPAAPARDAGCVGIGGVPLRAADGGQQHGVGGPAGLEHLVGERGAVGVDRGAADQVLVELEVADGVEHPDRGRDDLGADAVSGQGDYALGHGREPIRWTGRPRPGPSADCGGASRRRGWRPRCCA